MEDSKNKLKQLQAISSEILEIIKNSTCKIKINSEEKGSGFFLKFKNEYNFEINLLVTTYNILSPDIIIKEQEIHIITENEILIILYSKILKDL